MNKMCYQNLCVAINYILDLETNFNNYDDKINKQLHDATLLNNLRTQNSDPVEVTNVAMACMLVLS